MFEQEGKDLIIAKGKGSYGIKQFGADILNKSK